MLLRVVSFLLMSCMVLAAFDDASAARRSSRKATGVHDSRYAAIILDPNTGEVFHAHNADSQRYPASLTKMMTLYILFEELKAGRLKKSSKLHVSYYAAKQPQTNIGLKAKQKISVDDAIKALVVRSANDVAVVVAERISGSVKAFAKRSTATAKKLGMTRTIFQNPHGLPDKRQITTARDMAKLGIALRRDFPEYYKYFSTEKFSWKGSSYYTHNRVLTGFSGVDGIKTGYIRASGFNLVTSIKRGGRRLLGVVMGGYKSSWRDKRMEYLLGEGYKILAKRGNKASNKLYAKNLPKPREDRQTIAAAKAKKAAQSKPVAADRGIVKQAQAEQRLPASTPFKVVSTQSRTRTNGSSKPLSEHWGIQVGAFTDKNKAKKAVVTAIKLAPKILSNHQPKVIDAGISGSRVHRARLENLSESQARSACKALIDKNAPCFVYKAQNRNL